MSTDFLDTKRISKTTLSNVLARPVAHLSKRPADEIMTSARPIAAVAVSDAASAVAAKPGLDSSDASMRTFGRTVPAYETVRKRFEKNANKVLGQPLYSDERTLRQLCIVFPYRSNVVHESAAISKRLKSANSDEM